MNYYDSTLIRNQISLEISLFQDKHCDYHQQPSPGQVQVPKTMAMKGHKKSRAEQKNKIDYPPFLNGNFVIQWTTYLVALSRLVIEFACDNNNN